MKIGGEHPEDIFSHLMQDALVLAQAIAFRAEESGHEDEIESISRGVWTLVGSLRQYRDAAANVTGGSRGKEPAPVQDGES